MFCELWSSFENEPQSIQDPEWIYPYPSAPTKNNTIQKDADPHKQQTMTNGSSTGRSTTAGNDKAHTSPFRVLGIALVLDQLGKEVRRSANPAHVQPAQ